MTKNTQPPIPLTVTDSGRPSSPLDSSQTVGNLIRQVESTNSSRFSHSISKCRSVYIHIPFCFHKCHYCDFYSIVDHKDRQGLFIDRLIREIHAYSDLQFPYQQSSTHGNHIVDSPQHGVPLIDHDIPLHSVFIGGGTPTLLSVELWDVLFPVIHDIFPITPTTEFTVEANPETITPELAHCLAEGGVNRISIGAQSFNPVHLKTLERWHDPDHVSRSIEIIRRAGIDNYNLDLIFAIPGQTMTDWLDDLDRAVNLKPTHLSCYTLTYEPGTALTARKNASEFPPPDEDHEADLFLATRTVLKEHGFDAYEISNFALRDNSNQYQCRHNLAYWRSENWLALGPAASGHLRPFRWKNVPHLQRYLDQSTDESGLPPIQDVEKADPATQLAERMMMGLRLKEGIAYEELIAQADFLNRANEFEQAINRQIELGRMTMLGRDNQSIALTTTKGILLADTVIADLIDAIQ